MLTRWGRTLDRDHPWPEYPRPQLVRDPWVNLNGVWEYAVTGSRTRPAAYDGDIVVPFSPETELSGVGRQLQPDEWLWYRRSFAAPGPPPGGRVLLHFGAVDQSCTVWVNGSEAGRHTGGYLPFTLDITELLSAEPSGSATELLEVRVRDLSETGVHARGKQRLDRGTIWYTAQSGIWQTVWLEPVPASYVAGLVLTPRLGDGALEVTVLAGGQPLGEQAEVVVSTSSTTGDRSTTVGSASTPVGVPVVVPLTEVRPWSPQDPHLYDVEVRYGEDRVTSYAGLRSFGTGPDADGRVRMLLNGKPLVHVGVLDQGYWPDGLLTAPSDEAMVHDIETMRSLGFTVLRKHAKLEPLRWYAHCDRLGMLVWQDLVNGGGRYRALTTTRPARRRTWVPDRFHRLYGRADPEGRREFREEARATLALLGNVVSIAVWTAFNEGWGQFDANALARGLRALDPTRQVNATSGWVDQGGGDLRSTHAYLRPFRMPAGRRRDQRAVVLAEYGGYSLRVEGHDWSPREFGYRHCEDADELADAFVELHRPLVDLVRNGLAATVYTQLSDVEDELNGLLTWDREVLKIDAEVVRGVTRELALRSGRPPTADR